MKFCIKNKNLPLSVKFSILAKNLQQVKNFKNSKLKKNEKIYYL